MSLHLFAGLRVRDFLVARPWYERLLGKPAFFPHATEAVWTLAEDRSVYIVEHPAGPGSSMVTILVDDLDAQVAAIAARGLEPDERETYPNGVRKVVYRDPDGSAGRMLVSELRELTNLGMAIEFEELLPDQEA